MFAAIVEIRWVAVLTATLAFTTLGGLYFMIMVPKQYLYVTGRESLPKEKQAVSGNIFIVGPMACSLFMVIADACFINALGIVQVGDAAMLGFGVGLGFLVPMTFNIAINPLFPRPIQYGLLNAPFFLVANVVACVLLVMIPF